MDLGESPNSESQSSLRTGIPTGEVLFRSMSVSDRTDTFSAGWRAHMPAQYLNISIYSMIYIYFSNYVFDKAALNRNRAFQF